MVVRFVFTVEDLGRTRFAISPMWELIRSLTALRDPSTAALHVPWLRSISGRLAGIPLEHAAVLVPPTGYTPDFLTPPPSGPLGDVEAELATLRATPTPRIRYELAIFAEEHPHARLDPLWTRDPAAALAQLADVLEAFWKRAIAPAWPRVRAFLESDIAHRARRLAEDGPAALLDDLHPLASFAEDRLDVESVRTTTVDLAGRGLLLMPSVFTWSRVMTVDLAPWQPTVIYPARGIATLWEEARPAPAGLARLIGRTRATLLETLDAPGTTTELARRLSLSPATTSHHLAVLRDAGLVTSRREGRTVLYVRTEVAGAILQGPGRRDAALDR